MYKCPIDRNTSINIRVYIRVILGIFFVLYNYVQDTMWKVVYIYIWVFLVLWLLYIYRYCFKLVYDYIKLILFTCLCLMHVITLMLRGQKEITLFFNWVLPLTNTSKIAMLYQHLFWHSLRDFPIWIFQGVRYFFYFTF